MRAKVFGGKSHNRLPDIGISYIEGCLRGPQQIDNLTKRGGFIPASFDGPVDFFEWQGIYNKLFDFTKGSINLHEILNTPACPTYNGPVFDVKKQEIRPLRTKIQESRVIVENIRRNAPLLLSDWATELAVK